MVMTDFKRQFSLLPAGYQDRIGQEYNDDELLTTQEALVELSPVSCNVLTV